MTLALEVSLKGDRMKGKKHLRRVNSIKDFGDITLAKEDGLRK